MRGTTSCLSAETVKGLALTHLLGRLLGEKDGVDVGEDTTG
eukprot:CAMPEP_0178712032 /NCGR_PEP_ID=MMETSP0699-20121125/18662_1 /TAXON_ID=265572 /ORGANISM="Extubocellulus spinifer, Strain CCMP396" /LENGTH=40 /DNA_ID= /DNA_START= /DNA_END= /DNA_ORIENTATION=